MLRAKIARDCLSAAHYCFHWQQQCFSYLLCPGPKGSLYAHLTEIIIIAAFIFAQILTLRLGKRRARRQLMFALHENEIVRKREGWPDDRIAFSDVAGLYRGRDGLVVESTNPLVRVSIPQEVGGFEAIAAELSKHHPFSDKARLLRAELSGVKVGRLDGRRSQLGRSHICLLQGHAIALAGNNRGSHFFHASLIGLALPDAPRCFNL